MIKHRVVGKSHVRKIRNGGGGSASARTNLRMVPGMKRLIVHAAKLKRTTISHFMIQSSFVAAQEVLADRTRFTLSESNWKKFTEALDARPKSIPALARLLKSRSVLD